MSDTREHLHELVDRLAPARLESVAGLLQAIVESDQLEEADRRCIEEGEAWFKQHGGRGIPMEDVLAEFGLTLDDFPLKK